MYNAGFDNPAFFLLFPGFDVDKHKIPKISTAFLKWNKMEFF